MNEDWKLPRIDGIHRLAQLLGRAQNNFPFSRNPLGAFGLEAPAAPLVTPAPANPPRTPASKPVAPTVAAAPSTAVFPSAISPTYANEKPYKARRKTCSDQFKANKATNANGGLKWIQKGGGYWNECNKHLKG
jgi:hypothetical protein